MFTSILNSAHQWANSTILKRGLLFLFTLQLLTTSLAAQSDKGIQLFEPNKPIERELGGGQSHSYRIVLVAGQYLRVIADQRGIDVVVTMFGPDGKKIVEVDSPNGDKGPEPVAIIAETSGGHGLNVRSLEKDAPPGRYQLKIEELRIATQQDKHLISADQFFADAESLRDQGTAESLLNAIRKYEEAIGLYRKAENTQGEANALTNAARTYFSIGQPQKALSHNARALLLYRSNSDRNGEATVLSNIGEIHYSLGEMRKALDFFSQALPLFRQINNATAEATVLGNMGAAYHALGEPRTALKYHQQALPLKRGDPGGEAVTLNNIGVVLQHLGEVQKALDSYLEALKLFRNVKDLRGEASALKNIGSVYEQASELSKAVDYFGQALNLYRIAGDRRGQASAYTSIGHALTLLGEQEKALEHYAKALPLRRDVGDRGGEATTLNNIGGVYDELGEERKAIDYYVQALALYRAVEDRSGIAVTLNNIGGAYDDLGEKPKALDYFKEALPLYGEADRNDRAMTLNNIGVAHNALGEKRKALDYFAQTLPLYRAVGDRSREAKALTNLGSVYDELGEKQKALEYFVQALPLARSVGDRSGEAKTLHRLMSFYKSLNKPKCAIFYGKQSVHRYQELRSNIRSLDKDVQKTYLKSVEQGYRVLSDLLIKQQRYVEAQQVLNAFKDQQFFDSVKTPTVQLHRLVSTQREEEYATRYEAVNDAVGMVARKIIELRHHQRTGQSSPEETRKLQLLEAELKAASTKFSTLVVHIETEFSKPLDEKDKVRQVSDTTQLQAALRQLKRDTGQTAVAVYTLVGETKFYALIITADDITSMSSKIKGTELNNKARQLWGLLQSDAYDPKVLSRDLYNIVFKHIKEKLPVDTRTILWSLDGNLRYLPMGVLYDGKQYLVERYNHVNFTRADSERMTRAPSRPWTGLGMGSSQGQTVELLGSRHSFSALPGVDEELRAVFRADGRAGGVLEGEVLPDDKFTKSEMLAALARRRPVVHIASHFSFRPGDETRSFLLLGDGSVLTLAEMKAQRDLFAGVELLTLSACNTAAQQADADGREIDAFAELAQRLGANAVMATLWPLADESAPRLMGEFYRKRQAGGGMVKAEALRQAQLALLRGSARISVSNKPRQAEPETVRIVIGNGQRRESQTRADILYVEAKNAPLYKRDPRKPFAHPYYWAPVILIGNLR